MAHDRGASMTREEALLWLNDRIGKKVNVSVVLEVGDQFEMLFTAEGDLHHWREQSDAAAWTHNAREDISGLYRVGSADLDLTQTGHLEIRSREDRLTLDLADNASLEIVEKRELPS